MVAFSGELRVATQNMATRQINRPSFTGFYLYMGMHESCIVGSAHFFSFRLPTNSNQPTTNQPTNVFTWTARQKTRLFVWAHITNANYIYAFLKKKVW